MTICAWIKACHCHCRCCGTEPMYMYRSCEQHRMLTDFEGATRRSEVGFRIWTSKEFHQYQVVGRKLPTASDEHPKTYRMKLWATNEVRPSPSSGISWGSWRRSRRAMAKCLPLMSGEVVPPQLSSWRNPICCQRCEGGCAIGIPSKCPVELETLQGLDCASSTEELGLCFKYWSCCGTGTPRSL